jgi:uncharacterized protein YvpB
MKMHIKIVTFLVIISTLFGFSAHALEQKDEKLNIILNVPYYNQLKDLNELSSDYAGATACGPTALAIMLKNEGMNVDVNDVLAVVPNEVYVPKVGFYRIEKGSTYFNKESVKVDFSHKNIYDALNMGKPVFLNVKNYEGSYGHAVVIVGMRGFDGEKAESLIIHDVWTGPYKEFKFNTYNTLIEPGTNGYINYINEANLFYIK